MHFLQHPRRAFRDERLQLCQNIRMPSRDLGADILSKLDPIGAHFFTLPPGNAVAYFRKQISQTYQLDAQASGSSAGTQHSTMIHSLARRACIHGPESATALPAGRVASYRAGRVNRSLISRYTQSGIAASPSPLVGSRLSRGESEVLREHTPSGGSI